MKPCDLMMGFGCLHNFSLSVIYLICHGCHNSFCNKGILEDSKKLVVDLGEEMGVCDHIEPVKIGVYIRKSQVAWVYLREGGLLPFMKVIEQHDEHISMQFINSWIDRCLCK